MTRLLFVTFALLALGADSRVSAQDRSAGKKRNQEAARPQRRNQYPPRLPGAKVEVYKKVGDVELNIYRYEPQNHKASDRRPAIVFFFGGGWRAGSPGQFAPHCQQLAARGMVAMTADYRVASRHQVRAVDCVRDAKSAIRWVRQHAARLGVDPGRIVAGGGSAGGHLAACAGVIEEFEESGEDVTISSRPNALALFNPAVILAPVEGQRQLDARRLASLGERMGVEPSKLSPYHHVGPDQPPTIIFHGKADTTVRYVTVELFRDAMTKSGNRCELIGFADQPHGFFNYTRSRDNYDRTMKDLDRFLVSLGYLE